MPDLSAILLWFEHHVGFTVGIVAGSIVLLIATLVGTYYFLVLIPADYFLREHKPLEWLRRWHPAWRWTVLVLKNALGALLIVAGIIMIFTPGQGVLTLLLGLSLVDIPGKRAVERKILSQPKVLQVINLMRSKAKRPPLVVEPSSVSVS